MYIAAHFCTFVCVGVTQEKCGESFVLFRKMVWIISVIYLLIPVAVFADVAVKFGFN